MLIEYYWGKSEINSEKFKWKLKRFVNIYKILQEINQKLMSRTYGRMCRREVVSITIIIPWNPHLPTKLPTDPSIYPSMYVSTYIDAYMYSLLPTEVKKPVLGVFNKAERRRCHVISIVPSNHPAPHPPQISHQSLCDVSIRLIICLMAEETI